MKDYLDGKEKVKRIMSGGATEYYAHPKGIIGTGADFQKFLKGRK